MFNVQRCWNSETITKASSLYKLISDFPFIVTLVIITNMLDYTMPLTRRLQERQIDVVKCNNYINQLRTDIQNLRINIDEMHAKWYNEAIELASKSSTVESVPRVCNTQIYRENHPSETPSDYYKHAVTIQFLDHLEMQFQIRFSQEHLCIYDGFYLIPFMLLDNIEVWKDKVVRYLKYYEEFMPNARSINSELDIWETCCRQGSIPNEKTLSALLPFADQLAFPNICIALQILATVPVTSCECERNNSSLRRLKTWLRSSMIQDRLNGLALMHIHADIASKINVDEVVDKFAVLHPRRMRLKNIMED